MHEAAYSDGKWITEDQAPANSHNGMVFGDNSGLEGQIQQIHGGRDSYAAAGNQYFIGAPHEPGSKGFRVRGDVPARNPAFVGRDGLLERVHDELLAGGRVRVVALNGTSGVGKTQLAVEYAHRCYLTEYDVVWWISAEQPDLISEQMSRLAGALGFGELSAEPAMMRQVLMSSLAQRERWLLIFDNAVSQESIFQWLPGGVGNVLITSRSRNWGEVARPVEVDVLDRADSVMLLRRMATGLTESDADQIANELGDLPLALAQAGSFMSKGGLSAQEYVSLLVDRAAEILDEERPPSYPYSLAAAIQLAYERLHSDHPAAAETAAICGFLAPEPIPARWFSATAQELPPALRAAAEDPMAWRRCLDYLDGSALARIESGALVMHRLTQKVIRAHLPLGHTASADAQLILAGSNPGDPAVPDTWSDWERLLPHLLAVAPADSTAEFRRLAVNAVWYLNRRGDADAARSLAEDLHQRWARQLGDDAAETLQVAGALAAALRRQGNHNAARDLDEDILARRRRVLGEDHPDTLTSLHSLAEDLWAGGDYQAARDLEEDVVAQRRRVLGEDHPDTLAAMNTLAASLSALSDDQSARELNEDILARRRRVLGSDHPETLRSASNLARDLAALGNYQAARDLDEDILARRRRVLGANHPDTLQTAHNLARNAHALGKYQAALNLDQDVLHGRSRVLGEEHASTLWSASDLARNLAALGNYQAARDLDEDILARRRRALGEDHPDTLQSRHNLALDLFELDDVRAARDLNEDNLTRRRRVLGEDHASTLWSAGNLARNLWKLREYEAARDLDEDVLARRRRVLGDDHPDTLTAAHNLTTDLLALRKKAAARDLAADVLSRRRRVLGDDHPDTLKSEKAFARLLRRHWPRPRSW